MRQHYVVGREAILIMFNPFSPHPPSKSARNERNDDVLALGKLNAIQLKISSKKSLETPGFNSVVTFSSTKIDWSDNHRPTFPVNSGL